MPVRMSSAAEGQYRSPLQIAPPIEGIRYNSRRNEELMLTVADTLQLDELKGAQVVAGSDGLSREVGWVHVASVPDAPNWLNGGELVLTTSINMPTDPAEQAQYIQAMADRGVAALA